VIPQGRAYRYAWLYEAVPAGTRSLEERGVKPGQRGQSRSRFFAQCHRLLLALIRRSCIVVPRRLP